MLAIITCPFSLFQERTTAIHLYITWDGNFAYYIFFILVQFYHTLSKMLGINGQPFKILGVRQQDLTIMFNIGRSAELAAPPRLATTTFSFPWLCSHTTITKWASSHRTFIGKNLNLFLFNIYYIRLQTDNSRINWLTSHLGCTIFRCMKICELSYRLLGVLQIILIILTFIGARITTIPWILSISTSILKGVPCNNTSNNKNDCA